MKKLFVFAIMAMLLVTPILAVSENNKCETSWFCTQEISTVCSDFYGSAQYYTIAKWTFDGNTYVLDEQNNLYRYYNVEVSGNLNSADWTAEPKIKSVIAKDGENSVEIAGGLSGSVAGADELVFCGYKNGGSGSGRVATNNNGVPEFPALTVGIAVLVVTLGLVFIRRD